MKNVISVFLFVAAASATEALLGVEWWQALMVTLFGYIIGAVDAWNLLQPPKNKE